MGNVEIIDAGGLNKRIKSSGAGTDNDPFVLERFSKEFYQEVSAGNVAKHSIVSIFGRNDSVGTSFVPICVGGVYQMPQVSGATKLRIKAGGNANDDTAGTGAREITLNFLDETGVAVTETLATAGASASGATTATAIRLLNVFVSKSGTYADVISADSHDSDIVIENSGGGTDWATIGDGDFAHANTSIGFYTVPLGNTAFVHALSVTVDSTKSASIIAIQRQNILETVAPFTAMRSLLELGGVSGQDSEELKLPSQGFPALTDLGLVGMIASGTTEIDVSFRILLVAD